MVVTYRMRLGRAPLIIRGSREANADVENKDLNVDYFQILVVGQMFLMIVPCFVYLLTLLSFH